MPGGLSGLMYIARLQPSELPCSLLAQSQRISVGSKFESAVVGEINHQRVSVAPGSSVPSGTGPPGSLPYSGAVKLCVLSELVSINPVGRIIVASQPVRDTVPVLVAV